MEDFYNAYFADCVSLVICTFLGGNALSSRLLVFRGLPIPAGGLVGGRVVSLLLELVLNVLAFFLPVFFFSDLGRLGASYLWFAGVWVGYGLLASGLLLIGAQPQTAEPPSRSSSLPPSRSSSSWPSWNGRWTSAW